MARGVVAGSDLADTLTNLLVDPRIALLFLIPGVGDTFRVNGRAPRLGILVHIEEAFTQCPKALVRSDLWNPGRQIERSELPSSGAIMRAVADPTLDAEVYDRQRSARYDRREGLY